MTDPERTRLEHRRDAAAGEIELRAQDHPAVAARGKINERHRVENTLRGALPGLVRRLSEWNTAPMNLPDA
jgi:hypothetical protein